MTEPFRSTLEPVLGTRLTLRVDTTDEETARAAEDAAVAEADRLEAIFSVYRPDSAFVRWRGGELDDPPSEIVAVLSLAASWFERTDGAFHPCLGAAMRRWHRAAQEQILPERDELRTLVPTTLPFGIAHGRLVRSGDCRGVDVHGIAKGWIIDRMVESALAVDAVEAVVIDLGGDLRHARRDGESSATIAVEHPLRVRDNAHPLTTICIRDEAIATSGGARRGWRIGDEWFGHLLDPATGWPLHDRRGASVVAATAAEADAIASAVVVAGRGAVVGTDAAVLVVEASGEVSLTAAWRDRFGEPQIDR